MSDITAFLVIITGLLIMIRPNFTNLLSKKYFIILLISLIIFLSTLEINYAKAIEKGQGDQNKVEKIRINSENYKENPSKELIRYISNTNYYNNIWRMAAVASCLSTLLLIQYIPENMIIYAGLSVFTATYQIINWKIHHHYDFVFKSLQEGIKNIKKKKYIQEIHI